MIAAMLAGYIFSAGLVPSIERHTGDGGRLTWLLSVPGAMAALRAYKLPAQLLAGIPGFSPLFELSAEIWWEITDPPDTTP